MNYQKQPSCYVVRKIVHGNNYYLGKNEKWQGLITNALCFGRTEAHNIVIRLKIKLPNDKYDYF